MNANTVPVSQRGLLILIAAALLASGLAVFLGQRSPQIELRSESIVLHNVAIFLPTFRDAEPVNINTASIDELDLLPGIGPALAARIIAYRKAYGPFASIDDLGAVDGIGAQTVDGLRERAIAGPQ